MVTYLSFQSLGYQIEFQRELALKKGLRLETSALLTVFLEVRKHLHNNGRFMAFNSCNNNKVLLTFNDVTLNETCELNRKRFLRVNLERFLLATKIMYKYILLFLYSVFGQLFTTNQVIRAS